MAKMIHVTEVQPDYNFTVQSRARAGNWCDRMSCHEHVDADNFANFTIDNSNLTYDDVRVVDHRARANSLEPAWRGVVDVLTEVNPEWTRLASGGAEAAVAAIRALADEIVRQHNLIKAIQPHFNPFNRDSFPTPDADEAYEEMIAYLRSYQ